MTLIIDSEERDVAPTLLFTNSFGCQELIYCTGKHEVDPQYTRDAAYMGGIRVNYRITEQRTFNADTGYLGTDMANWADDLFRSDEVYLVNFIGGVAKVGKRVTLSDSKSKRDNLRDSVPRFTFSYTYAQRQHNVLDLQRPAVSSTTPLTTPSTDETHGLPPYRGAAPPGQGRARPLHHQPEGVDIRRRDRRLYRMAGQGQQLAWRFPPTRKPGKCRGSHRSGHLHSPVPGLTSIFMT